MCFVFKGIVKASKLKMEMSHTHTLFISREPPCPLVLRPARGLPRRRHQGAPPRRHRSVPGRGGLRRPALKAAGAARAGPQVAAAPGTAPARNPDRSLQGEGGHEGAGGREVPHAAEQAGKGNSKIYSFRIK